jgi:hypothetical protein
MKNLYCFYFLFFALKLSATTFYVANSGSDSNSGSIEAPWQTISKVNQMMSSFLPGTQILFKSGDIFNGGLLITASGTKTNPIYFGKYGTGNDPIIIGTATVTNWINVSGNIWQAPFNNNATTRVTGVFINGVKKAIGRYPNPATGDGLNGFGKITKITNTSFSDETLPSGVSFVGAELITKAYPWQAFQSTISNMSSNTITLNPLTNGSIVNEWGYIIRNHINTLDLDGEWYYDVTQDYLYLYSSVNPNSLLVEATNVETLVTASTVVNIVIENLQFNRAQGLYACHLESCASISFNKCTFLYNNFYSFYDHNSNFINISNCYFSWNQTDVFVLGTKNSKFISNSFQNTALNFGDGSMKEDYKASPISFNHIYLENSVIQNNTFSNIGYSGIGGFSARGILTITENRIDTYNLVYDDGGGIYIHQLNNNVLISKNIVKNGIGSNQGTNRNNGYSTNGIYLDNGCTNVKVFDNTVVNVANNGIFIQNDATHNTIKNNIVFQENGVCFFAGSYVAGTINYNNIAEGNVFYSASYYDKACYSAAIPTINKCKTNRNYYIKPFSDASNNFPISKIYTTQEWNALTGNDLNSKQSPITLPRFTVSSTGNNSITNGTFNSNTSNWLVSGQGNAQIGGVAQGTISWLSEGVLKLTYNNVNSAYPSWLSARTSVSIISGQKYLVKFSYKGDVAKKPISVMLWYDKSNVSTGIITDTNWKQASLILEVKATATGTASLSIEAQDASVGSIYLDNIEMIPVTASYTYLNDYVNLFTNETDAYSIIDLPTLTNQYYCDKDGYLVNPGNFTLAPFTSRLIFKTATMPQKNSTFRASFLTH